MGIFFEMLNKEHKVLTEIEAVNPETDQDSADNSTDTIDYTDDNQISSDNPADAPDDYTVPDGGEDQTPEEADQNPPEEGTEAGAVEGEEGMPPEEEAPMESEGEYEDPEMSNDEIRQLEDEIFSKLNSGQIAIMHRDLKSNFNKLFISLDDLVDRINDIPKINELIKPIEFVSNKLAQLRDMVSDYLYFTYDTKSYTENQISYKRYMILANQIADLIGKIKLSRDS